MPDEAAYAAEEERRRSMRQMLEQRTAAAVEARTAKESEDLPPTLTQLENDLVAMGVYLPEPGEALARPVNTAVPAVLVNGAVVPTASVGAVLTCTMGEWTGEPSAYAYQWQRNGVDIVSAGNEYTAAAGDAGAALGCIVSATNGEGTTAAPPSNTVTIDAGVAAVEAPARRR